MTDRSILNELADAAEALLATTPDERRVPRVWFARVDRLKLAISAARSEPGRAWDEARDGIF